MDIIQFFDDWITGRTKILRENAYQLSKTQLEENIQDRAMHVSFTEKVTIFWAISDHFALFKQILCETIFLQRQLSVKIKYTIFVLLTFYVKLKFANPEYQT